MEKLLFKVQDFEGPLDLLEHLIRKNKLDICTVSLIEITEQYIEYINKMQDMDLEVSSEFLVMASELLYIKSKALLPKHEEENDAEDSAQKLTEALRERRRMRIVAEKFKGMQYDGTYFFFKEGEELSKTPEKKIIPHESIDRLYSAFLTVLEKTQRRAPPPKKNFDGIVSREPVSVKDKAKGLVRKIKSQKKVKFENIFEGIHYKNEVVAIFLAVLELLKLNHIIVYEKDEQVILEMSNESNSLSADELINNLSEDGE